MACTYDMTPGGLAEGELQTTELSPTLAWEAATAGQPYRRFLEHHAPHRLPDERAFDRAIRSAREKGRLDRDPLVAIRKLVDLEWREIFQ